jgi:hypothetical protein
LVYIVIAHHDLHKNPHSERLGRTESTGELKPAKNQLKTKIAAHKERRTDRALRGHRFGIQAKMRISARFAPCRRPSLAT